MATSKATTQTSTAEPDLDPVLAAWRDKRDRLADVEITRTLEALEASPNQDGDVNKWKIDGVGNIIVKPRSQAWLNGNLGVGGGGSVNLVMHALELEAGQAVKWLADKFQAEAESSESAPRRIEEDQPDRSFAPPDRDDQGLEAISLYLCGDVASMRQRGLPESLVKREIAAGRLYSAVRPIDRATGEASENWRCVFIGPSSAEIRSIDADGFKGCCPGSDSERSGYQIPFRGAWSKRGALVEAAIDGLSLHALDPSLFVLSTNGSGRFDLQYQATLEFWRNGAETLWALDADDAGDTSSQRLFNALVLRDRLSERFDVSPEQIDEWMLQKKIISRPHTDPRSMFAGLDMNLPEGVMGVVPFSIPKAIGTVKRVKDDVIEMNAAEIAEVSNRYRVKRLRPVNAKDWNEVWTAGGQAARNAYEKRFQTDQPSISPDSQSPSAVVTTTPPSRWKRSPITPSRPTP